MTKEGHTHIQAHTQATGEGKREGRREGGSRAAKEKVKGNTKACVRDTRNTVVVLPMTYGARMCVCVGVYIGGGSGFKA